jgi:hypothetical protein
VVYASSLLLVGLDRRIDSSMMRDSGATIPRQDKYILINVLQLCIHSGFDMLHQVPIS